MSETWVAQDRLLLRPEEVARSLAIGRTAVFELIRTGELRSVKIGKSRRIPADAVVEYLAGHKADRAAVVRQALEEAGIDPDDHDELSVVGTDGRWCWELLGRSRVDAPTYAAAIAQVIRTRQRWRAEYEAAKAAVAAARAGPGSPAGGVAQLSSSATSEGSE